MEATNIASRSGAEPLPGASFSRDISAGEHVEKEIDSFISKRLDQRVRSEGERRSEETWAASEKAYTAHRREEMRARWCEHHQAQAARLRSVLEALIASHEEQAEKYQQLTKGSAA